VLSSEAVCFLVVRLGAVPRRVNASKGVPKDGGKSVVQSSNLTRDRVLVKAFAHIYFTLFLLKCPVIKH
jgi:hypothetical protein